MNTLISVMCYETELICHVLQWLADTCQYNTTLYCERGHSKLHRGHWPVLQAIRKPG